MKDNSMHIKNRLEHLSQALRHDGINDDRLINAELVAAAIYASVMDSNGFIREDKRDLIPGLVRHAALWFASRDKDIPLSALPDMEDTFTDRITKLIDRREQEDKVIDLYNRLGVFGN
jgi:hypothetical protein